MCFPSAMPCYTLIFETLINIYDICLLYTGYVLSDVFWSRRVLEEKHSRRIFLFLSTILYTFVNNQRNCLSFYFHKKAVTVDIHNDI